MKSNGCKTELAHALPHVTCESHDVTNNVDAIHTCIATQRRQPVTTDSRFKWCPRAYARACARQRAGVVTLDLRTASGQIITTGRGRAAMAAPPCGPRSLDET